MYRRTSHASTSAPDSFGRVAERWGQEMSSFKSWCCYIETAIARNSKLLSCDFLFSQVRVFSLPSLYHLPPPIKQRLNLFGSQMSMRGLDALRLDLGTMGLDL